MVIAPFAEHISRLAAAYAFLANLVPAQTACAQWTAIRLHPVGAPASRAFGVGPSGVGGSVQPSEFGQTQPALWSEQSSSWINLSSSSTVLGEVFGVSGGSQVGQLGGRASLWQGTAASRVDLHPSAPGVLGSEARAIYGSQQVGTVFGSSIAHAGVWHGSAGSFVDLHPPGWEWSLGQATDGVLQGGVVNAPVPVGQHAALWSGTAASFVDLNPTPNANSEVFGMAPGQQVGYVFYGGGQNEHAAMWSGSAASLVDLNPSVAGRSVLHATDGFVQAGEWNSTTGGFPRAGLWFGTSSSFMDLSSFLPPAGYFQSFATGVFQANGQIYVSGWAQAGGSGPEAFLWVGIPSPGTGLLLLGGLPLLARRRR